MLSVTTERRPETEYTVAAGEYTAIAESFGRNRQSCTPTPAAQGCFRSFLETTLIGGCFEESLETLDKLADNFPVEKKERLIETAETSLGSKM